MDAYTTVVPPQYRGQKIAEKLCDAAYKYAMEQGYNVLPTCSYIASRYICLLYTSPSPRDRG